MKKRNVEFKGPAATSKAKAALVVGGVCIATFLFLILYSGIKKETPKLFASVAVLALMMSFMGFIISIKCVKADSNYRLPYAGTIVNGLALLIYIITYVLGIV